MDVRVLHNIIRNFYKNVIKRNVDVTEKNIVVLVVNEKDQDQDKMEEVEVVVDYDSFYIKKEEINRIFEIYRSYQKEL